MAGTTLDGMLETDDVIDVSVHGTHYLFPLNCRDLTNKALYNAPFDAAFNAVNSNGFTKDEKDRINASLKMAKARYDHEVHLRDEEAWCSYVCDEV